VHTESGERWAWYFAALNGLYAARMAGISRRLEMARLFLDANLEDPLTLSVVARRAHFSKFHFLRLFKDQFHETPLRYLRRRRLEAAQRLLVQSDLPVTAICFQVGFESLGSFSSLFRRAVGVPPNEFRRRYVAVPRSIVPAVRLIPDCWLRRYGVMAAC
jgi:AraC-like DNA-binding protein